MPGEPSPDPTPKPEEKPELDCFPAGLEDCPRCGEKIGRIIWGQTNCPRCGLHFECC